MWSSEGRERMKDVAYTKYAEMYSKYGLKLQFPISTDLLNMTFGGMDYHLFRIQKVAGNLT